MKRLTKEWVEKAEADWVAAQVLSQIATGRREALHDQVGFHCQQSAEKYLKALMQESGLVVPRTHDLVLLVALLSPGDATLGSLSRTSAPLTRFAVGFRYPGRRATKRQAQAALRHAEKVRASVRARLKLPV